MIRDSFLQLSGSSLARDVVTRTPLKGMARRFVAGETLDDLTRALAEVNREGMGGIANFLGESVHDEAAARQAASAYLRILNRMERESLDAYVSVKFTALGQDISDAFLAQNMAPVLDRAEELGRFLRFDMEGSDYTQRTLDAFEKLWSKGRRNIGIVLQSYLHRTVGDVARMNQLGASVRLCKGAYAEPASIAFQEREEVNASFVECMRMLLWDGANPAIATHDEAMIDATVDFHQSKGIPKSDFSFQMLYGVRRDLQQQLADAGFRVSVYIPFGTHWYPYLMRRLAERPANVLFLAGSVVKESPLGFLWPGKGRTG